MVVGPNCCCGRHSPSRRLDLVLALVAAGGTLGLRLTLGGGLHQNRDVGSW